MATKKTADQQTGPSHEVMFYHPAVNPPFLSIVTGIDEINWGYRLNTANFPTYAGEVIQILSVFVDDMTVIGSLQTYQQMEDIYTWIASYLQTATQGTEGPKNPGVTSFSQIPVKLRYPHRGWEFDLFIKEAPGFRYGRDVVVPQWQIRAHVVDESPNTELTKELVKNEVLAQSKDGDFSLVGQIGYQTNNPFSDPMATPGVKPPDISNFDATKTAEIWKQYGDYFIKVIDSYGQGKFPDLEQGGTASKPAYDLFGLKEPEAPKSTSTKDPSKPKKK